MHKAVCGGGVAAGEGVYTWTDEKGVVHITNQTPPANAQDVKILYHKPAADQDRSAPMAQDKKTPEDRKREALEDLLARYTKQAEDARARANYARNMALQARKQANAKPAATTRESLKQEREREQRQALLLRSARQFEAQALEDESEAELAERKRKQTQAALDKLQ